jgi:hypothetical protein
MLRKCLGAYHWAAFSLTIKRLVQVGVLGDERERRRGRTRRACRCDSVSGRVCGRHGGVARRGIVRATVLVHFDDHNADHGT